ncbi:hypothetical protein HDU98_006250, partial [Podochytrium sp. JEL0797]
RVLPMKPFLGFLNWKQVVSAVSENRLDRFSRTVDCTTRYLQYINSHTKKFASVSDCIKIDILGFPSMHNADGKIEAVQGFRSIEKPWVLERNHFPYALEGVEHWVLWTLGEKEMAEADMQAVFEEAFPDLEFVSLTNPPHLKSVPDIHHSHVFVRRSGGHALSSSVETLCADDDA